MSQVRKTVKAFELQSESDAKLSDYCSLLRTKKKTTASRYCHENAMRAVQICMYVFIFSLPLYPRY